MSGLLSAAKNILSGNAPGYEAPKTPDNRIDRTDQCKVVWYQWKNELGTGSGVFGKGPLPPQAPAPLLAAAKSYDISNHVESFSFNKTMANGAGSFSMTLENSFDWPRWMRPGQWICIYLTGDGDLPLPKEPGQGASNSTSGFIGAAASAVAAGPPIASLLGGNLKPVSTLPLPSGPTDTSAIKRKLRCMGIIQRVAIKSNTNSDGVVETTFTITGKDFGAVFEETELWFNASNADGKGFQAAIESITTQFTRNLTELLDKWYDIFLSPSSELANSVTSIKSFFPVQWVLPDQLVKDLELDMNPTGSGTFGDIQGLKEFNATTFENPDPSPFAGLQGQCWQRLKSLSQPEFHELFTELSDAGNPKLIFRPIPWASDKSGYPTIGKLVLEYRDLTAGTPVPPLLPLGTNTGNFTSLKSLVSAIGQAAIKGDSFGDSRSIHSVAVTAKEVESYDLGPDWHSRFNFFLVDAAQGAMAQQNAFALMSTDYSIVWPIRDEADIKRHGFRPQIFNINSFLLSNSQIFGNRASIDFMKEANFFLKDLWSNAEDLYSGTLVLAGGRNDVKLGKVVITDATFKGISEMAFYIEGYTDTFNVNGDGTCSWTQSLSVTRGTSKTAMNGGSTKDKQAVEPESFHAFENAPQDGGTLGKIKNTIKDPTSLLK